MPALVIPETSGIGVADVPSVAGNSSPCRRFAAAAFVMMREGRVEELLVAEELWNDHKKPFFFPFSSVATCKNHSLEVDQRVKEKKAAEFAALKQKGMSVAEYEAQFARLAVYAPHLVGTERLKANRFMDGLRPMFIEMLGPHNIQTYTEMVQRAQLVEDTMAKVEGMRGKDISKPTFIKRGAVDTTGTFPNNNNNNNNNNYNNKRPTIGKDYGMEKKIKVEETKTVEYCNFCNKPGHRAEECWKKAGACLRCGNRDHRLPNCPMLKDQAGRNQMNNMGGHRCRCWTSIHED
ncbi:hypothetical protein Taro_001775 [Colocasia esculenta]|uniref:CCHC-type domain-containing protein n=1 Tax=Colocasia esculenta TaxID=4460 RepID=A0A843TJY4_COLES|nr:hypothetical protein [Colocasia esculenta]